MKPSSDQRMLVVAMFLLMFGLNVLSQTADEQDKLWSDLVKQYNTNENMFDKWAIVEGVPLVKTVEGVPPEFAAAASILSLYADGEVGTGRFFEGDQLIYKKAALISENLNKSDFIQSFSRAYFEHMKKLKDELYGKKYENTTPGQNFSLLLKKNGGLEESVQNFLKNRFYIPSIKKEPFNLNTCRTLIDNGVPFIFFDGKQHYLCLGYLDRKEQNYLILFNLNDVEYGEIGRGSLILGDPNNNEVKIFNEKMNKIDKQFGKMKTDLKFFVKNEKQKGLALYRTDNQGQIISIPNVRVSHFLLMKFYDSIKKTEDEN